MENTADTAASRALDHANYAGFWVRFFAATIDMILYTLIYLGICAVFPKADELWGEIVFTLFMVVTYAAFFSSKWQSSPGMHLLRFHICDVHGHRVTYTRALWWGITSLIGTLICCGPSIYMAVSFDITQATELAFSCVSQNIDPNDCTAEIEKVINIPYANYEMIAIATSVFTLFMLLIWALSVALPKDKTGFHNIMCGTRFLKGRP